MVTTSVYSCKLFSIQQFIFNHNRIFHPAAFSGYLDYAADTYFAYYKLAMRPEREIEKQSGGEFLRCRKWVL